MWVFIIKYIADKLDFLKPAFSKIDIVPQIPMQVDWVTQLEVGFLQEHINSVYENYSKTEEYVVRQLFLLILTFRLVLELDKTTLQKIFLMPLCELEIFMNNYFMLEKEIFMLNAKNVEKIFLECLFDVNEKTDTAVIADGIKCTAGFKPEKIKRHESKIMDLLLELPEQFMQSSGGGWSFLNACNDKHGNQWTGLHTVMEQLFQLGIAIGKVKCLLPREAWSSLPGGMPYYVILDKEINNE